MLQQPVSGAAAVAISAENVAVCEAGACLIMRACAAIGADHLGHFFCPDLRHTKDLRHVSALHADPDLAHPEHGYDFSLDHYA